MVLILASKITFKAKEFIKEINKYDGKSLRRAVYVSANELGFLVARNKEKGLPFNFKQNKETKFIDPVPLTLNSVLYFHDKNKVTFKILDDESKGNSPAKYLYPVIGGGSNKAYLTRFTKWLHRNGYARKDQYPYPNTKNTEFIKTTGANNRVLGFVYANTQRALNKTKEGFFRKGFVGPAFKKQGAGGKIQGSRVFAKKEPFGGEGKLYRPGIYRVKTDKNSSYIQPLFIYGGIPNVKPKKSFGVQITEIAKKELPNIIMKNVNKYGKTI